MIKTTTVPAFLAALFVTAALPAWAEAPKIPAAQVAQMSPRPPMWVVKDADSTLYLLGTVHAMREGVNWMTPAMRQRFDASSEVWFEVADMDNTARVTQVAQTYMLDMTGGLTTGLTPEEVAELDRRLPPCGGTTQTFKVMKKWAVAILLVQCQIKAMGLKPENGIDMVLLREARAAQKPVYGLETMEAQMEALSSDTPEGDLETLRQTLKDLDATPEIIERAIIAWLGGDTAALEDVLVTEVAEKDRDSYERLMVARNRNWVPKIQAILAGQGTVFIAVGSGHLVGDDSIIAMLDKQGIEAEAVNTGLK